VDASWPASCQAVTAPAASLTGHDPGDRLALVRLGRPRHDVILVGPSYGGMVITGVADRAAGRVG
jgi:hypothetical protein